MKTLLVKVLKTVKEVLLFLSVVKPIAVGLWNELVKTAKKVQDIWT